MPVPGPATKRTGTPATGVPAESVTRTIGVTGGAVPTSTAWLSPATRRSSRPPWARTGRTTLAVPAEAVSVWTPAAGPRCHSPGVARPDRSVVVTAESTAPAAGVKLTGTPGARLP